MSTSNFAGDPSRLRSRWVLFYLGSVNFLTAIGNLGLVSIMPAVGRDLDIPDYLIASIFSLSALIWAVSSPIWAAPVARQGPNPFIRFGLIGFIISMGGCALAVAAGLIGWTGPIATFLLFLTLRSCYGIAGPAASTATQALVAARTHGLERTQALTALTGAVTLGTIVGPALAPLLIVQPWGSLGVMGPMVGFALIGALALAASFAFLPKPVRAAAGAGPSSPATLREVWKKPVVGRYLLFGLVLCSAQAMNLYTIGFVLIDRLGRGLAAAQPMIGLAMTGGAAAALLAQWGLGRVLPLSPQAMMQAGAAIGLFGNLAAIAMPGPFGAMIGFVVASFGFGMARPGFASGASLGAQDGEQVAVASSVSLINGASVAAPPVLAAFVYQYWSLAPFAIPGALLLVLVGGNFGGRTPLIVRRRR